MLDGELVPPWVKYPGTEPWWGGWRQGLAEPWFRDAWLPFWTQLLPGQREEYLRLWPPPTDDWRFYLTRVWTSGG